MKELLRALLKSRGIELSEDKLGKYTNDFLTIAGLELISITAPKFNNEDWNHINKCLEKKDTTGLEKVLASKYTSDEFSELVQNNLSSLLDDYIEKVVNGQ